ncbi:MAG: saccharopine dehydrogenase NADP-binding domain-containing protein [Planctomycetales bacterium]|nr:saccharopine dehydrogenase NADP-binding domain-containing protein [Planctomycetales bacterium]
MHKVLLLGGGKIGRMIVKLLSESGDFDVTVADCDQKAITRIAETRGVRTALVDATDRQQLAKTMADHDAVISALSYRFNPTVAQVALEQGLSYFDLTEDVETTRAVREVSNSAKPGQIFMPQCGLAPGFVSIAAYDLTRSFDRIDKVHMRVGALPQFPTGELKYNLTWSTDGLINEYCNPCEAIQEGTRIEVLPLEGLEQFSLDGVRYEAFNTSGGLGTLCETLDGKVRELNYKTVRYLGHRHLMSFLVHELRMSDKRGVLKSILEDAVPITFQDVVVTFCTVSGWRNNDLVQISDARKVYAQEIDGEIWSAIQLTTAAGICTVVDLHVSGQLPDQGFVRQERVELDTFLANRFGKQFDSAASSRFSHASHDLTGIALDGGSTNVE